MRIVTHTGEDIRQYNPSTVAPDPSNTDSTDFPMKGCRQCGKRDRPQWKGTCNDDECSQFATPPAQRAPAGV